ncbi:hypothetical protein [Plantactinospora sp. WMMB782]
MAVRPAGVVVAAREWWRPGSGGGPGVVAAREGPAGCGVRDVTWATG